MAAGPEKIVRLPTMWANTKALELGDRPEAFTALINLGRFCLRPLVLIAAMIHFLVASQAVVLVFFFLPTLYSAYHFGRRHATLTACAQASGLP